MRKRQKYRLPGEPEFDSNGYRLRLKHPPELKEKLCDKQDNRCAICGGLFNQTPDGVADYNIYCASFEHVIRFADGGADDETNLVITHLKCNLARGTNGLDLPVTIDDCIEWNEVSQKWQDRANDFWCHESRSGDGTWEVVARYGFKDGGDTKTFETQEQAVAFYRNFIAERYQIAA